MMGQLSKQILTLRQVLFLGAFAMFLAMLMPLNALANSARLVSDVVVDPLSGVAMNGFDPISYFVGQEPERGSPDFELYWNGVAWYFSSEANLEVFSRSPRVYAPAFGGHGVMSLARGFLSDGNPLIYKVLDNRLYLFYSFSNREAFDLSDKQARLSALEYWQDMRSGQD